MSPEWVRNLRYQCGQAGIPFFFKQWGGVRKKETGRRLDGRTYDEFPEFAESPTARGLHASARRQAGARMLRSRIGQVNTQRQLMRSPENVARMALTGLRS
jgi:hypothetical protein